MDRGGIDWSCDEKGAAQMYGKQLEPLLKVLNSHVSTKAINIPSTLIGLAAAATLSKGTTRPIVTWPPLSSSAVIRGRVHSKSVAGSI